MSYCVNRRICGFALLALITARAAAGADPWKPVDPADLALKAPRVEKDADAEALFWDVRVLDEAQQGDVHTVLTNYVRLKVFTERGREKHSTVDVPYYGKTRIGDVTGRTIKPDGSVLELQKDAIFDRTLVKAGGLKVKSKSFAMPGVEPGAIIEYRWREYRDDQLANYIHLPFQRDVPVQQVRYHIKPLSSAYFPYAMRTMAFRCKNTPFVKEQDGFYITTADNMPALVEEPRMPPENEVLAWMLVYYSEDKKLKADQYWKDFGKQVYRNSKPVTKVNGDIRRVADSIVNGAANDTEKLRLLFEYCRTKIKNTGRDTMTAEDRADAKRNKNPVDTINQGVGTGFDIDMAFIALANAAGFDARMTRLADRGQHFFNIEFPDSYFLRGYNVAVNVDGKWRFYDPASTYVPFGMLRWQEEGQQALVADPKDPEFAVTPMSPPEKSKLKREGRFRLSEEGTLEGDVRMEYTGHEAVWRKILTEGDSPEQRIESVRERVKYRMSTAEVDGIEVENASDPEKPLIYKYHVKVPGYAQRTGKRMLVQLAFFEFNEQAMFPAASRKYPVYFEYPWSEDDMVEVDMPQGFELDHPDAPASFSFGKTGNYKTGIQVLDKKKLRYTRKFEFGGGGTLLFPAETYPQLKKVFDLMRAADDHALILKQNEAAR